MHTSIYSLQLENDLIHFVKKVTKNLRIIYKQYAHLQTKSPNTCKALKESE